MAKDHDRQLSYIRLDVTDPAGVAHVFSEFVSKLRNPIRGLVACAGVSDNDPATEFSVERFRRITDINLVGTFTVAQAVAKEMRNADVNGSMVLVASMSGTVVNKVSRFPQKTEALRSVAGRRLTISPSRESTRPRTIPPKLVYFS